MPVESINTYCTAIKNMKTADRDLHQLYHDKHYGFPIADDNELFCRLILEINQAGLSWTTILRKQENFRIAYHNFNIKKVAAFNDDDVTRLLNDAGIIRNRLKIKAALENAKTIIGLQNEFGSFKNWLSHHHPKTRIEWTILFKKTFRFTGGEIVNEFLLSTGYLPGAHHEGCEIYKQVIQSNPSWKS